MNLQEKLLIDTIDKNHFYKTANKKEDTDCWIWSGNFGVHNSPRYSISGKWHYVTKLMHWMFLGDIPERKYITSRSCDEIKCVNPRHFIVGEPTGNRRKVLKSEKSKNIVKNLEKIKEEIYKDLDKSNIDACWHREEQLDSSGYSKYGNFKAHRLSYEIQFGDIGNQTLYRVCNGKSNCINPYHWTLNRPIPVEKKKYVKILSLDTISQEGLTKFNTSYSINADTGCWLIKGAGMDERPVLSIDGVHIRAYRLSAFLHHGNPPEGKNLVRHLCNTPACCSPFHICWGDDAENGKDKSNNYQVRGYVTGINNCRSTFETEDEVLAVWNDILEGLSDEEISLKYHKNSANIRNIRDGVTWNHITGLPKTKKKRYHSIIKSLENLTPAEIEDFWSKTAWEDIEDMKGIKARHLIWKGNFSDESTKFGCGKRGIWYYGGKNHYAYKVAYFLMNGHVPLSDPHNVMRHVCGHSLCVAAGIDPRLDTISPERFKVKNTPEITETHIMFGSKKEDVGDLVLAGCKFGNPGGLVFNKLFTEDQLEEAYRLAEKGVPATDIHRMLHLEGTVEGLNLRIKTYFSEKLGVPKSEISLVCGLQGEVNHNCKISDSDVFEMRRKRKIGEDAKSLAKTYSISRRMVDDLCYGNSERKFDETLPGFEQAVEHSEVEKLAVTEADKKALKDLYNLGDSAKVISQKLGFTIKRVEHIITDLQKLGVLEKRLKRTKLSEVIFKELRLNFQQGLSATKTSEMMGLAISTVEKRFAQFRRDQFTV